MLASARMLEVEGVEAAMAAMATPLNLGLLRESGLWDGRLERAGDGDLVLAARGADPSAAIAAAEAALAARPAVPGGAAGAAPRTVRAAARGLAGANLAVISVPGAHAAWACWDALGSGLNVFCFSDNVPIEQEVQLKDRALELGLLFMGPDCGTAIVDGVGLGFWNEVPRGRIGLVGASGTGLQQLCCLLALQGAGISHAIGVGGRDLGVEVGGRMAREAVRRLDADPGTDVIVVVSKPAPHVELRARKPLVMAVLGPGVDLTEVALRIGGGQLPAEPSRVDWERGVDGIFAGGTLRDEAALVWAADREPGRFSAVDYGADELTRGRPHPMIDNRLRVEAIRRARGLVYLDVVLGHGAHPDPAAELAPAVAGRPAVVALIGTGDDPQGLARQRAAFEVAGAHVFVSNSRAAGSLVR
jgi:FdrA protein